jgi:hypothetical protein
MENLQNFTRYTGTVSPVETLTDAGAVDPSEVLTDEELEKQKEAEDKDELSDETGEEVAGVPTTESHRHIVRFGEFPS